MKRALWLTEDPALIQAQLDGEQFPSWLDEPPPLHFGVNTDAIINGGVCTFGYTGEILGPYLLDRFKGVIQKDTILNSDFDVIVGGDAFGSGSSREVAVVAHQGAGIELVVAPSFQRIFQENLVYVGLPFTTDFSVLQDIEDGKEIDLDALRKDLPPMFRVISAAGGLLSYGTSLLAGEQQPPYPVDRPERPMNIIEKIVAKNCWTGPDRPLGVQAVEAGDQVLCQAGFRGVHEYTGGMVMTIYNSEWAGQPLDRPELIAAFEDHFVLIDRKTVPEHVRQLRLGPARKLAQEMLDACEELGLRLHGPGRPHEQGICHRIVLEQYARPGDIVILTDSHTPTAGVLNTLAFGVGSTAMAFALRTGMIPVTVPKTVRVVITGKPVAGLTPKDLILHLIGSPYFREEQWRTKPTDTCALQLGGPGLDHWSVDELSVMTNMTVEGGMMTGIVEPCEPVREFLRRVRPDGETLVEGFIEPDAGAEYIREIEIDLADVPLTVALPGDSRNRCPLDEIGDVPIHNVVIASCTGGSLADLRAAAEVLRGRSIAKGVRVTVIPSSAQVAKAAESEGLLDLFRELGATVSDPGCGSCIGNGPGIPLEGETTASTTNRNFDRRMGAPGPVYLVSPAIAAAAAVEGRLADPRRL